MPRCLVLLAWFLAAGTGVAQLPPAPASPNDSPAGPFGDDDRTARLVERYKAMLATNPAEGIALERLWKAYEDHGATGMLVDEYRQAADAADKPAAALIYGHVLQRAGRLDEAATAYERAARLEPDSPLPFLARADLATARSRPVDAAASMEQALAKMPAADRRRNEFLLKLGEAWMAAGQPLKAGESWEKLVASDPANFALRKQLAAAYEKNGLIDRAIGHYESIDAHANPAERANALRELGRLHEARGEFEAARDALEHGLTLTARDNWLYGELQGRLIRLHQRAGKVPELEARWRAAVEQAPRDLGGYLRLIALAEAQGSLADERTWLEKVVALAPRDRDSALKLARLLADTGEHERAASLYDQLLKLQPGNLDLILARAELDLQAGHAKEAVARLETRLSQNPADETVAVPALQFFLAHHLDEAAEKYLEAGVARQPTAAEPSLALAKFYFTERRTVDARAALEALVNHPGDTAERARRWTVAAEAYKEGNQPDDALRCWQQAAALQPSAAGPMVAASELLLSRGDTKGAIERLEQAVAILPDTPERVEVEHKLFQMLSDASAPPPVRHDPVAAGRHFLSIGPGAVPGPRIVRVKPSSPPSEGGTPHEDSSTERPLSRYLSGLEKAAEETPTVANDLRLARWQQWARLPSDALLSAQRALQIDANNIPAREIEVVAATAQHRNHVAARLLREIISLDPSRKSACSKQIADLLLEEGEYDAALAILDELQRDTPGSIPALTDLALAQQRTDHWYDALATWERAYALPRATPAQRADLRRPMLSVYERLGQFQKAAETLQAAVDAQDDLATKQDLFRELVAFCQNHSLGPWLQAQYEARLKSQPQDYFTLLALAELQKAAGNDREAYRLLGQAYYSSPVPAAALRRLVAEAETLGENDEAVAHQRHLVALTGQASAENLEKLADLETSSMDDAATTLTWEQIVAKFPRDTAALGTAAEFFEKTGKIGRARELLAQIIALDPTDFRRTYHLGQLDLEAGDLAGARGCLAAILDRTEPEKAGDPLLLPTDLDLSVDPALFAMTAGRSPRTAVGGIAPATRAPVTDNDDRHLRLKAIREMTQLLFPASSASADAAGQDDRRRWLDRWRAAAAAGAKSEPLAAFFYADQKAMVMDLISGWLPTAPPDTEERVRTSFLLAGLRLGEYSRLAQWAWNRSDPDHMENSQTLIEVLQYFLATGGRPGPTMVAELFPPELQSRATLWQAASAVFAEKRWYVQAVELGERALALPGGSIAGNSFDLAQWELNTGRLDAARNVLRKAVEEGGGTSFDASADNAVFADLRACYLLLPADQRAEFVHGYLTRMRARSGNPAHALLSAALLHGLADDEGAALQDLDRLVALRLLDGHSGSGSPNARRWAFLSANGVQLQAWNLDSLAAHLWRRALAEASAFDKNDPEVSSLLMDIRIHLLASEVVTASDPQQARERVEGYLREQPSVRSMAMAAAALLNLSQSPSAVQLYEHLCRVAPTEAEYQRSLLGAYDAAGNHAASERLLTGLVDGSTPLPNGMTALEPVCRLASVLENSGDAPGARRLLERARRTFPHSMVLLTPLAQSLEKANLLDEAAAVWREAMTVDPVLSCRLALVSLEERRGQPERAIDLLKEVLGTAPETNRNVLFARLVRLYLAHGRTQEATELARRWVREGRLDPLPDAAAAFAERGQRPTACELLASAVRRTRDPVVRFRQQQALVEQLADASEPMPVFLRELRRLGGFSEGSEGLRYQFASIQFDLASKRGATDWLEGELKRQWRGEQGDIVAGERLAALYLKNKQEGPLREVVSTIDHRPNLPQEILFSLEARLVAEGYAALALPLSERLYRRFPQNEGFALMRARALWKSDHRAEANQLLDVLEYGSVFRDDFTGQVGQLYLELGDKTRARESFEMTASRDPLAVRAPDLHCRLAALYLEDKRLPDVYRVLRTAYRNPTMTDMEPLVNFLAASGRLKVDPAGYLPGGEFPLTFSRRAQLLVALYDRLSQSGRAADAHRLVSAHPELLAVAPVLAAKLSHDATPEELPALTGWLETALRQVDPPSARLRTELAKLLGRSADTALAEQPPRAAEAIAHLARACQLAPDDFPLARQLATLYRQQKQDTRAAEVLKTFLSPDALPAEREQARQLLGRR